MAAQIANYDSAGYDYQTYWHGRDYERWAEDRALRRLVHSLGEARWLADFGGGFGRNAMHYRGLARQYVLVDYSTTNLANAAQRLAGDVRAGRAFLVRADLNRLPFVDGAFDAAMVVRVLHHLPDVDNALAEMGRTVSANWLVDVPIKHHVLGLLRAAAGRRLSTVRDTRPIATGITDQPFWNFNLSAVRRTLGRLGWDTTVGASVNNLRRLNHMLPVPLVRAAEAVAQSAGRGWWGPSQFVMARRVHAVPAQPSRLVEHAMSPLALRMVCPECHGLLGWTEVEASCATCAVDYPRREGYWDFGSSRRRVPAGHGHQR
jgi:SAM-dependent methyltransferase